MLEKWMKHFFGEKILSSLMGVLGGALSGVATVAVAGNLDSSALVTGAVGGAAAAVIGAGGRMTGEPKPSDKKPVSRTGGTGVMLLFLLVFCMTAAGCNGVSSSVGDGKVDAVEAATIRLAVGAAMSAKPETIVPAYAVTKTLLAVMDGSEAVQVRDLESALDERIDNLHLTPLERQSVSDLVTLVRANITDRISGIAPDLKLVVVRAVIEIVHETAYARLQMIGSGS